MIVWLMLTFKYTVLANRRGNLGCEYLYLLGTNVLKIISYERCYKMQRGP